MPFRWFPNATEQMKQWFNTTSGFICGVFVIGFLAFAAIAYCVMHFTLQRCTAEYESESGKAATEQIVQECRVKVGLGRSDGKDRGYWQQFGKLRFI